MQNEEWILCPICGNKTRGCWLFFIGVFPCFTDILKQRQIEKGTQHHNPPINQ